MGAYLSVFVAGHVAPDTGNDWGWDETVDCGKGERNETVNPQASLRLVSLCLLPPAPPPYLHPFLEASLCARGRRPGGGGGQPGHRPGTADGGEIEI